MTAVDGCVDNFTPDGAYGGSDETQPLLQDHEGQTPRIRRSIPTPLPKLQLATLCALRLADPIAFTQIFPYVNEMMERFGVATDPSQTGFYSGLVESVFALSQLISIYQWAGLSDRIGRRPVVFAGTIGIAAATVLLGFSRTLAGVLIARSLAGLFSGNVAVMHSVLGELTDSTNQALAYPIYGLCWPLGIIVGPLIGGFFSHPAQKFPGLFDSVIFRIFPYLLPSLVVAALTFISVMIGYFCLKETLPRKARIEKEYSISYGLSEHADRSMSGDECPSSLGLLSLPVMRALCTSGCALSFVGTAFDVVFVLFCYSPVKGGGLSFSVSQIGYALAVAGLSSAAIQIILMPILLQFTTCSRLYKLCMALWPLAFIALPFLNWIARNDVDGLSEPTRSSVRLVLWISIGLTLAISRVACLAFSLNMMLVKQFAPGPSSLGTANGLAQFAQCSARAVAPAFVSSLFAFSVDHDIMNGHLWMIVMFTIASFSWVLSTKVPDDRAINDFDDTKIHARNIDL